MRNKESRHKVKKVTERFCSESYTFKRQLTIVLVRPLGMAVHCAWHAVRGPAGVSDAKMDIKLHIKVDVLLL